MAGPHMKYCRALNRAWTELCLLNLIVFVIMGGQLLLLKNLILYWFAY